MTSEVFIQVRNAAAAEASIGPHGPDGELRDLLQRFLEPLVRLAGAQGGAVRVLSDTNDRLQLVGSLGRPENVCRAGRTGDRHCGYCGDAADNMRLVWATDLSACSTPASAALDGQQMLTLPLRHRQRVLGVCNLFFATGTKPGREVLAVLESVGELLGLALDNARLESENLRARLTHERQAMAAEVHDSLAQSLTFVKMRMPLLRDAMLAHDDVLALRYFDDVRGTVSQAHSCLRGVLAHFRTPPDPQGLAHALDASAQTFRRTTGTELEFANGMPDMKLAPEQEVQVFHIVQEALTNVARHAAARHAALRISQPRQGAVEIVVEDDGAGLPATAPSDSHYGLEIMLERARRLGGTLDVGPRAGGGTRVRLVFPLSVAPSASVAEAL